MTQTTLREYLLATEDSISSGRIDEAMTHCQNVLTYFPEALEAQRLLGEVYLAQGHLEEAQQTFEWILTNDPENVIVYCDRALISERVSDIDTALDCYQQAYELSRGNANIRQEFNQLSARAGQQEFMFSRAGLARLYMRGDLLTQAIQEWDAVLAINPERLDARLGLLETYWREGMYDKAEQIAMQLLEEIPTCLKALLYLAHIASISNIQRARDLLQRAESLDPELFTAQEIFTDLTASQPNDPFLQLIRRDAILLEDGVPLNMQKLNGSQSAPIQQPHDAILTEKAPSSLYGNGWGTLDQWEAQEKQASTLNQPVPETPAQMNWNVNAETLNGSQQTGAEILDWTKQTGQEAAPSPAHEEQPWYQKDQFASEQESPVPGWNGTANNHSSGSSWNAEALEEEPVPPAWLDTLTHNEQTQTPSTETPDHGSDDGQPITPPEEMPTAIVPAIELEEAPGPLVQESPAPAVSKDEAQLFFLPSEEENEGEMGWPEWLKSLGAEALDPETSVAAKQPVQSETVPDPLPQREETPWTNPPVAEQSAPPAGTDPWAALPALSANNDPWIETNKQPEWMQQLSTPEYASAQSETRPSSAAESLTPDWMQQLSTPEYTPAQSSTPDWMQQLSTQEQSPVQASTPDWMQQLSTQEQSPVQASTPDWMQQLSTPEYNTPAQQTSPESAENTPDWMRQLSTSTPDWMQQFSITAETTPQEEPALPVPVDDQEQRYIASLEDLEKSFQTTGFVPLAPGALASIAQGQTTQPQEEPSLSSALAQLGSFPQSPLVQTTSEPWWSSMLAPQESQQAPLMPSEVPANIPEPVQPELARPDRNAGYSMISPIPPVPMPVSVPEPQVARAEALLTPAYNADALLDSDLETTMKRPAIQLRPIEPVNQNEQAHTNGKNHNHDRKQYNQQNRNETLTNHDRLVKAYQHQLNGSYDDAMQEYRIIIRNAPELLDDVISNMRALLKLNPRFSLGYRVLGDAYMRKGEYLQAMESYNKALTMAKKAHF